MWYRTQSLHIHTINTLKITDSSFRNCGYRSDEFNQYDMSETRGCGDDIFIGCDEDSSVFGFLTHSDEHNPELMQGTRGITFDDVGRRFLFSRNEYESVSGRLQNWIDVDGSVSGLGEPTLIASGYASAGHWWKDVDDDVFHDEQAPLEFIKVGNGPARGMGHVTLSWDDALHATVGDTDCVNGRSYDGNSNAYLPSCNPVGRIRHLGPRFDEENDPLGGLPVTANPDIVGLTGGYGWFLSLDNGSPHTLTIDRIETSSSQSPMILSIAYPQDTKFTITANAASWCSTSNECTKACTEMFTAVASVDLVRNSIGNVYHFDSTTGVLTIRVTMVPTDFTGQPQWKLHDFDDVGIDGTGYALRRFERDGVLLPKPSYDASIQIAADCSRNGAYCSVLPSSTAAEDASSTICPAGYTQVSYDACCETSNPTNCEYAYTPSPPTEAPSMSPTTLEYTMFGGEVFDNNSFEGGNFCPWYGNAGAVTLNTIDDAEHGSVLIASGRVQTWQGPAQDVTNTFRSDVEYLFSAHVKLQNGNSNNVLMLTLKLQYDDEVHTGQTYKSVWYTSSAANDTWIEVSKLFTLDSSSLPGPYISAQLYFQGPDSGVDILVDDVSLFPTSLL